MATPLFLGVICKESNFVAEAMKLRDLSLVIP